MTMRRLHALKMNKNPVQCKCFRQSPNNLTTAVSFCFPRTHRLVSSHDFNAVFAAPVKSSDAFFTVLARPTAGDAPARLGLAIARKQLKRAVDRNRIKRLIRESFRLQASACLDYVVMTRHTVRHQSNADLRASLSRHFQRIAAKT